MRQFPDRGGRKLVFSSLEKNGSQISNMGRPVISSLAPPELISLMPSRHESIASIDELINRIGQLHASPTVAQKVLQLTRNPEFEIREVATCLEKDPALAARILRVVNSSRYGLSRQVSNIRHAAAYLGQRSLRMFAITFALVETLASRSSSPLSQNYWPRAITMATTAALLCDTHRLECRDAAYTSGLLADVGILILAQLEAKRYEPLFESHEHGTPLLEAEQNEFAFTHPMLGARLLQLWEVPDSTVNAVANHHQPDSQGDTLCRVVQGADLLASAIQHPTPENLVLSEIRFQQDFGMDRDAFVSFIENLEEKIAEGESLIDCGNVLPQRIRAFQEKLSELEDTQVANS